MLNKSMFSTGKDNWETPDSLFQEWNQKYPFILDAAADSTNHKCDLWLGPGGLHEDALSVSWREWLEVGNVWLNPPYSRKLQQAFVKKAAIEAMSQPHGCVVCLLPARTDTKLFHDYIYNKENVELTFLKGRIKFVGAEAGAPFPSMIAVFQ